MGFPSGALWQLDRSTRATCASSCSSSYFLVSTVHTGLGTLSLKNRSVPRAQPQVPMCDLLHEFSEYVVPSFFFPSKSRTVRWRVEVGSLRHTSPAYRPAPEGTARECQDQSAARHRHKRLRRRRMRAPCLRRCSADSAARHTSWKPGWSTTLRGCTPKISLRCEACSHRLQCVRERAHVIIGTIERA